MSDKEQVYFKICNAVLKLEVSKGHLVWRLSDIAKESGVTRSLIYYYFGKEKEVIFKEACRYMIDLLFNVSKQTSLGIQKRMQSSIAKIEAMPYLFVIFFLEKNKDTELGEMIRKAEKDLLNTHRRDYPEKTELEILNIYITQLGSIAYRNLDNDQIFEVFDIK